MTRSNLNVTSNIRESSSSITVANNDKIFVKAVGDVLKKVKTLDSDNEIMIKNVQYVPDLCTNLLSVAQMVKNDNTVVFNKKGCVIYNSKRKIIATADLVNDMFKLNTVPADCAFNAKIADNIMMFHRRMGHLSLSGMRRLKNVADVDFTALSKCSSINCVVCAEGKQCKQKFENSVNNRANDFLELIHSDVCVPMGVNSIGGARFYVTFIDDFSRNFFVV